MKRIIFLLPFFLPLSLIAQNVGINTETPEAALDVNGDVIFRAAEISIDDTPAQVLDVNTFKYSYYRITGPTDDFDISGVSSGIDGRTITLFNRSGYNMTLHPEDVNANPEDQIITQDALDLVIPHRTMVNLIYDGTEQRWIVKATSKVTGAMMGWDTSGMNLFYDNNIGIGTSDPVSPLTIQTEVNETGLTQIGGVDSITLSTLINSASASIGTSSMHPLSLKSGGVDQMHLLTDGRVVMGLNADPSGLVGGAATRSTPIMAKLTLETGINQTGWMHIGGADSIIVQEAIGGVSASIGTATSHAFRLHTNGESRFNIDPLGKIWVGPGSAGPYSQFTVFTGNNSDGISQVGADGQYLTTRIGGSSAGIGTFTPTIMRIFCNSLDAINIDVFGNVGIGVHDPLTGYKLSVNGNVKAKELVIETTGWPDYVFENDYKPLSLGDLEAFINTHRHLPNIPPAAELEKDGVSVGEMQKKMMEKIEELTLYVIELNNKIEALETRHH